ncbi:MAG: hypothetical protein AAGG72_09830, partial [Pseudomonadota bacterium]
MKNPRRTIVPVIVEVRRGEPIRILGKEFVERTSLAEEWVAPVTVPVIEQKDRSILKHVIS